MALPLLPAPQLFTPLKSSDILEALHHLACWKGDAVERGALGGGASGSGGAPASQSAPRFHSVLWTSLQV